MEEKSTTKGSITSYFKYLIFVLILVQILDSYTTSFPTMIPSQIINEFLSDFSENTATAIFALITGIASAGMYICALNQYFSDKFGRRIMLIITIVGMVFVSFLIMFSQSIINYSIYLFVLWFFTRSDIWLIYVNEEAPKERRAVWTNVILIIGMVGVILAPIFRSMFITDEASSNWRGLPLFTIILGIPLALLILFTLKSTKIYEEMKGTEEIETSGISFKVNFKNLMKSPNRSQVIALMVMSFIMGINSIFRNLVEQLLSSNPYLNQDQINIVLLLASISVVFAFIIIGILGDKVGRLPLLYVFAILIPIARILVAFGSIMSQGAFILSIIGGSLSEIGYWGEWVLISMIILEVVPTQARGTGSGLKSLSAAIGITLGFFMSSFLTLVFNLGVSFIILSLLLLINIILIRKNLKETKHIDLKSVYE